MNKDNLTTLFEEIIDLPNETEWVEFKENNFDPEEVGRLISALSNSANLHQKPAGYLIFGVSDNSHKVVGTTINLNRIKEGQEDIQHWIVKKLNPRINTQLLPLKYDGKQVIIIEVPTAKDRPTYFNDVAYIRIGSITKNLLEFPDKERVIWNNPLFRSFEKESALSGLTNDEVLRLIDYPRFFELMNLPLPPNKDSILENLLEEKVINKARGSYNITNLGALLFSRRLDDFSSLKRKAIRIIVYKGDDRINTLEEKRGERGYALGFKGIVAFINGKLPANEKIKEAFRVEEKMYPEIAIRELIANALIHQDFLISGTGPIIEIFTDRIEIYNPGKPLINTSRFIDHPPRSRNEELAALMRRMNICEERGSGIDKVISSVEAFQLPAPKFETFEDGTKVTLFSYKKYSAMDKLDKIRACYQHCCLNYVSNRDTTNASVRKRFEISEKNYSIASRIIADTIDAKLIRSYDPEDTGSRKKAKYVPFWAI